MHTLLRMVASLATLASFALASSPAAGQGQAPLAVLQGADADLQTWRALSRFGYGPSPALVEAVRAAGGGRAWALAQLELAHQASREEARIPQAWSDFNAPLPLTFSGFAQEREARRAGDQGLHFSRDLARHAAGWRIAACSQPELESPLLARMTEFWFNHLNVFAGKAAVRPFAGHYALHVARAHALGRFEDLLLASASHPAMLLYLDQAQSVAEGTTSRFGPKRGLNENYARELLELHTLGVDGGYSQRDVRELARVLTGWTVNPRSGSGFGFVPRLHDQGEKEVLGHRFTRGFAGQAQGQEAIALLARHPATAQRIALRLARFFVADQPDAALVQRLAQTYLATQGDIRSVMRTLIESPETWAQVNRLFKTPMDYACSVLLVTGRIDAGVESRSLDLVLGFLAGAGQPVHGWQTPDGYRTDAATWLAPEALTRRADFALGLARGVPEPPFLRAYLAPASLAGIARESEGLRTGLMLASPDFMYK